MVFNHLKSKFTEVILKEKHIEQYQYQINFHGNDEFYTEIARGAFMQSLLREWKRMSQEYKKETQRGTQDLHLKQKTGLK